MQQATTTDIKLSAEQEALFKIMEQTHQDIFITGRAGTGKSVLLRYFREQTEKKIAVAAPTGIAALNVKGQTIHSLFKLAPELYDGPGSLEHNSRLYTLLKRIDTLVIDEISMVRADLLDAIDERFRKACDTDVPFGGKQIIMFGDCYQLPPVVDRDLMKYFEDVHKGYFFFNALVWGKAEFQIFELTQVFRQKDPIFKDILNAVRDGSIVESQIEQLNARYGAPIPNDGKTITLAPTNSLVTNINQRRLDQLEGKVYEYKATVTGRMSKSTFPTEEVIQLKVGAQVVLLQNDKDKRWVNGTVATIASLEKRSREEKKEEKITVRVDGTEYALEKATWEEIKYEYDPQAGKVKAEVVSSFTQYPIRLAWALTIHKSQGQTYESVALDLTTATFAPGQMYVALSRCTSLEGLYLKMPVKQQDIIVDAKVAAFMSRRETIKVVEPSQEEESIEATAEQEQTKAVVTVHDGNMVLVPANVQLHHDEKPMLTLFADRQYAANMASDIHHDEKQGEIIIDAIVREEPELVEGRVSRIAAIEVLCPACNSPCIDTMTGRTFIVYEMVGHTVKCSVCEKKCIVPLNAFSLLQGDVIAREQPKGVTNAKREKKGRTKKEKTSNRGRKAKDGVVREPLQLSISMRTYNALNVMGVNKSALFEELLEQYDPFLQALAMVDTELDHDEIDDTEEEATR